MFHFVLFAQLSFWSLVSFAGFRACLIYICLTVYEFSFILLIHHIILLILISVLSVTFWTLTYYNFFFDHALFERNQCQFSCIDALMCSMKSPLLFYQQRRYTALIITSKYGNDADEDEVKEK